MKYVIKPLAESLLIPLGLTAAAEAAEAEIHKKILGSGHLPSSSASHDDNTMLIISNDEMEKIIEIVEYPENSSLLPEGVSKTS